MGKKPLPKLSKKQNLIQGLKFILFSAGAGIIQAASFALFNELTHFPYWPSYIISQVLSILFNFTVNRQFTFKSANNVPLAMLQVAAFYCVFLPLSTVLGNLAAEHGFNRYLVLAVTMLCNLSLEFLYDRFVVYRHSINTNKLAQKEKTAESSQKND